MQRAVAPHLPRGIAVLGLVEFTLSFAVIYTVIQAAGTPVPLSSVAAMLPRCTIALAVFLTLLIGGVALTVGLYRPEVCRNRNRMLIAVSVTAIIAFAALRFLGSGPDNQVTGGRSRDVAEVIAAWFAAVTLIRLVYGFAVSHISLVRRIVLLGDPSQVNAFSARLHARRFAAVPLPCHTLSWSSLRRQGIWGVVIASGASGQAVESLLDCKLRGVRILSGSAFQETYLGRIDLGALTVSDLLFSHGFAAGNVAAALKRMGDIAGGTCMLILFLPLMAMTALAIKIDSPGPVLYCQKRVGHFGNPFTLFKFRSMSADAEESGNPRWAQQHDPRITRIGRFIRATRIDELPQLANVIRGEMSLVGPRPERPHFVEQLARAIPFYRERAYVKPGLTGWAQVNFPYGASVQDAREKLAYDLYYVKNRTLMLDLIILVLTIRVVLFREGAR